MKEDNFNLTPQYIMYTHKLRIPPQHMWRALTLTTLMILIYQNGPGWIHSINRIDTTPKQVNAWQFMHTLISNSANEYPESLAVCEIWLSVHGIEIATKPRMKDLDQKWANIMAYWRGYRVSN